MPSGFALPCPVASLFGCFSSCYACWGDMGCDVTQALGAPSVSQCAPRPEPLSALPHSHSSAKAPLVPTPGGR